MVINIKTIATLFSAMAAIFVRFLFASSLSDHFVNFTFTKLNFAVHPVFFASSCSSTFPPFSLLWSSLSLSFFFFLKEVRRWKPVSPSGVSSLSRENKDAQFAPRQIKIYVHIHEIICWKVEPNKFALKMGCLHWNMKIYACIHRITFT